MLTRNEAYHRARLASEKILKDAYQAADRRHAEARTVASAKLRRSNLDANAKLFRYALAADNRAAAYAEAEQQHRDRLAAIQRRFGPTGHEPWQPRCRPRACFCRDCSRPRGAVCAATRRGGFERCSRHRPGWRDCLQRDQAPGSRRRQWSRRRREPYRRRRMVDPRHICR